jgi:hypothetical protein
VFLLDASVSYSPSRWSCLRRRFQTANLQRNGHFAAAAEIEERFGAPLLLACTHAGWARALIARGRPEDLDRAQQMLEQAEDAAGRLGAEGITREVAESRAALAAING